MATVLPKTILLRGRGERREAACATIITPGMLVDYNSTVSPPSMVPHATAGGNTGAMFAVENDLIGLGINDNYAVGDYVQAEVIPPGGAVYALVAAGATAILKGNKLESAGNGTLRIFASGAILAEALEPVDNSAGGASARIRVQII